MPIKALNAGRLRHWVDIEQIVITRDSNGEIVENWELFKRVPAAIEPLSTREFFSAQSLQSQVTTRIVIRSIDNITSSMRIVHGTKAYNIEGLLSDKSSGIEYITLPCSEGVNDG